MHVFLTQSIVCHVLCKTVLLSVLLHVFGTHSYLIFEAQSTTNVVPECNQSEKKFIKLQRKVGTLTNVCCCLHGRKLRVRVGGVGAGRNEAKRN